MSRASSGPGTDRTGTGAHAGTRHALAVLELDRVLERVAARAASEAGRARVRALLPTDDPADARRELDRVERTGAFLRAAPSWGMPPVPDGAPGALARMAAEGALLEPLELHALGVLLRSSGALAGALDRAELDPGPLASLRALLVEDADAVQRIERTVDADGAVLDTASPELKRIRGRLKGAHARVVKQLETFLRGLDDRFRVPDASVSIRDGRYVIPLRREGKGEVGGIVHDVSQSGATLFVEPPLAVELTNQLRELEREEAREVRRILGELTGALAPRRHTLEGAWDALVDFDALHARARTARDWDARVPELDEPGAGRLRIVQGRHPLLLESGDVDEVVPYDVDLAPPERALVVSGPNTGGKSVFLKAVGLASALAQSGVVPPVGKGTRLPVFASFWADIGDEQSIARSLSTFSAHLVNLIDIVEGADARSLVLVDEMGTGTDPAEGAALSRAVLDVLVERGALTIVSSHLGELKRLDGEGSGVVNASMQFDPERIEPTYRFVKGRPGRSYGLAIAGRLGFPPDLLERAEGYRSSQEAELEDLLARLEAREREVARLQEDLAGRKERVDRLEAELAERERTLDEAERTAESRARADARKELMEARSVVEEAIAEVRAAASDEEALEEATTRARRKVEEAARERRQPGPRASRPAPSPPAELREGGHVRVRASGASGRLVEIRTDRGLVEVGALKLELPLTDLEPAEAPAQAGRSGGAPPTRSGGWSGPDAAPARTELDLRGLRVDEMELELQRGLDDAIRGDLAELRIIHGKGTGALRQRVGEMLDADPRVRTSRMGGPGEGGAGVTVASFR